MASRAGPRASRASRPRGRKAGSSSRNAVGGPAGAGAARQRRAHEPGHAAGGRVGRRRRPCAGGRPVEQRPGGRPGRHQLPAAPLRRGDGGRPAAGADGDQRGDAAPAGDRHAAGRRLVRAQPRVESLAVAPRFSCSNRRGGDGGSRAPGRAGGSINSSRRVIDICTPEGIDATASRKLRVRPGDAAAGRDMDAEIVNGNLRKPATTISIALRAADSRDLRTRPRLRP